MDERIGVIWCRKLILFFCFVMFLFIVMLDVFVRCCVGLVNVVRVSVVLVSVVLVNVE